MADPWATLRRAARDGSSGASAIAERSAQALSDMDPADIPRAIRTMLAAHPSMAPLWNLASEVLAGPDPSSGAARFLQASLQDGDAGRVLGRLLSPWVLTISRSDSVVRALRPVRLALVSCMRSDPGGEGERMAETISSFARAQVIEDDDAIRRVPAGAVLMGADAIGPSGIVNKAKSRALAEAAASRGIPMYAVAGWTKFASMDVPLEGPFERVPGHLLTGVATPSGLLAGPEIEAAARDRPVAPDLIRMAADLNDR